MVKNKSKVINNNRNNNKKWSITVVLILLIIVLFLVIWTWRAEKNARVLPNYARENIEELVYQEELSNEDYLQIFYQTGLSENAVEELRRQNRQEEILQIQDAFFAILPIECDASTVISREERVERNRLSPEFGDLFGNSGLLIPYVEKGDILISFNAHVLGWRNGHAAIVVDSENRITLEARVLGTNSKKLPLSHWYGYPSFVVLRLKDASREERGAIADYAQETLLDLPYRLEAGIWDSEEELAGTQCAHLVWYAYRQFGYDLDSDGGNIVTPRDIFESPRLEIIQIYGMEIME